MSPHEMSNVQNQYNTDDFHWTSWLKIFVATQRQNTTILAIHALHFSIHNHLLLLRP
jgi:hypothetical protein